MKKVLLSLAICLLAMNVGFAQNEDIIAQPTHVVGKRINAAGEVTSTLEADFSYDEEGKVVAFACPQYGLTASYLYAGNYLRQEGVCHAGASHDSGWDPNIMEFLEYTYYENGSIKHIKHDWSEMNSTKDWEYTYDEYGRLKQKDYKDGTYEYFQHYIYYYENEDKTVIEYYWTSWVPEGLKLKKKTISQYDDNFNLITVRTEIYNLEGDTTSTTMVNYTYTPLGKEESQIKQTLNDGEWINTSIQRYFYDEYDHVVERQNGSWSAENDDWNINKKIIFNYEPQEEKIIYTVSFYKKSGEEWVWDVFDDDNQTVLFGPLLKTQQRTLRHFAYEDLNGSGRINQFEFTFINTMRPIYLDVEEKGGLVCNLYPNPSTGMVTISGTNLKQAQIINTLGQCVATVKGEGEQLTVDISNLPAGVYFVNITDSEGRKCVKKVVKE